MNWVLSALDEWAELAEIEEGLQSSASRVRVSGVIDPVKALLGAAATLRTDAPTLIISPTGDSAERLYQEIRALCGETEKSEEARVLLLPALEALLYEDVSPDPSLVGERLRAMRRLAAGEPVVVVASAPAVFQRCLPPDDLRAAFISLTVGETIDRDALLKQLIEAGYQRESMVDGPGQVSSRGGVLDIYPAGAGWPVRLELFGDEIESLRTFDPATQRSLEAVETVSVPPAREVLLTQESIDRALPPLRQALARQAEMLVSVGKEVEAARLEELVGELVEAVGQGAYTAGIEYLLPFLYPQHATVLDYLPEQAVLVVDEPGRLRDRYGDFLSDLEEIQLARLEQGMLLPLPNPLHLPLAEAEKLLERPRLVELCLIDAGTPRRGARQVNISCQPMAEFAGNVELLCGEVRRLQQHGWRVFAATKQAERLIEILDEGGVGAMVREDSAAAPRDGQVVLSERPLREGFRLPGARLAMLTDRELFGWRKVHQPYRRRASTGVPISSLTDLHPGDYVVHINHGVGIYRGLVRRGADAGQREYLLVEYAGDDRLYVPAEQFDRVQKYLGGEEERPAVHRLGGGEWERTKRRVRRSARELAQELLRLYAARDRRPGHAFGPDTPWQREMEDGFLYEETPDQRAAIEAVRQDMEAPRPMDRLVCGDVGYGKTEVAIRAAFKAVMDGKQVAVLVPTTVLAQQHYTTFGERLAPYPVRIEMLSRFRSPKEQRRVAAELAAGSVDIVIGTHRLFSKDIEFKQLGLVVIDEEQRFGVRHKEKLKQLRTTVDVLTLTATPIPRTLHMALTGIRNLSVINDPPEGRTAVITRAVEREDGIIREAIFRELERGGQVYVLHNRVQSIEHVAEHIRRLVPHARIAVAHGQMHERHLERAMLDFYAGDAQVLVCTTIIENGLDIPNSNTLIVTDADRLGLAQLYQLRGRVGRSSRQAYAYLMWTAFKRLTEGAERRIAAIREFSQLGSGFKIALRDLEIRGAGNLLGPEQHGYIAAVGYELYLQMLSEAVEEAQTGTAVSRSQVSVDLPISAYLPETYAPDLNQRIDLYRRLSAVPDQARLDEVSEEIADRFGRPLPEPVGNLIRLAALKVRAAAAGVRSIAAEGNLVTLRLSDERRLSPAMERRLRRGLPPEIRIWLALLSHDRVVVSVRKADEATFFERLERTLDQLTELPLEQEARRHERRMHMVSGQ